MSPDDDLPLTGKLVLGTALAGAAAGIALASGLGALAILAGLAADRLRHRPRGAR